MFLPLTLNNFLVERKFTAAEFAKRWKEKFLTKLRCKPLKFEGEVWLSGKHLKKYFNNLRDLSFETDYELIQEKGDYKHVLWVEIREQDFMVKIRTRSSKTCVITVKAIKEYLEMAKYLLNTLVYLLTESN